eukprot:5439941-Pleurochrysis_carterae.AAC.1
MSMFEAFAQSICAKQGAKHRHKASARLFACEDTSRPPICRWHTAACEVERAYPPSRAHSSLAHSPAPGLEEHMQRHAYKAQSHQRERT